MSGNNDSLLDVSCSNTPLIKWEVKIRSLYCDWQASSVKQLKNSQNSGCSNNLH